MSKLRPEPAPITWMIAAHSALRSMSDTEAFWTFRILPRIGSRAWKSELRASLAVSRALSPSTMNSSLRSTSSLRQSASLAGRAEVSSAFLRREISFCLRADIRARISATTLSSSSVDCVRWSRFVDVSRAVSSVSTTLATMPRTGPVRGIVAKVVETELTARLTSTKRDHRTQSTLLLDKVVAEMRARMSARKQKEISRRKNALETSALPAKLADCRSDDVDRSELFIVEGDSALDTAKLARSSDFQALLPIRGKILNVQKASVSDMLRNAECAAIIQVIGAGSGRSFDIDAARYGKIVLMTDADVDGAHIRTLLLTLFFRYMRPLVDEGRVYAAVPPLHRVEVLGGGGKKNEYVYTYSEADLASTLHRLQKAGRRYKDDIQPVSYTHLR